MGDFDDPGDQQGLEFGCDSVEVVRRIETFTSSFLESLAEGRIGDIEMVRCHTASSYIRCPFQDARTKICCEIYPDTGIKVSYQQPL
jgi:hypothetical protein